MSRISTVNGLRSTQDLFVVIMLIVIVPCNSLRTALGDGCLDERDRLRSFAPILPFYRMLRARGENGVSSLQFLPRIRSGGEVGKPVSIRACTIASRMQCAQEGLEGAALPTEDRHES